jgi:hypothetical protein
MQYISTKKRCDLAPGTKKGRRWQHKLTKMNIHWIVTLDALGVLFIVVLIFINISVTRERNFFMQVNTQYWKKLQAIRDASETPLKAADEYEMRIAAMQDEIAAGCKIIEDQKAVINNLRALLKQSQDRNRTSKHRK